MEIITPSSCSEVKLKPKILLIGAAYGAPENCKKLEALAKHCRLTAVTVSKARSIQSGIDLKNKNDLRGLHQFVRLDPKGNPSSSTRYLLSGLSDVFKRGNFDLICVESEPWGFIYWQAWWLKILFQKNALVGSFTWENLKRPFLKQLPLKLIYRLWGYTVNFVICGSLGAQSLVKELAGKNIKSRIAPQIGVDHELFDPVSKERKLEIRKNLGLSTKGLIVGFCGRLTYSKGVDILLAALSKINADNTIPTVSCAFLGRGEFRERIRRELGNKAFFPEPLSHDRVCEFMQAIDVLVLPSRTVQTWKNTWKEQFGHVLIEAMACQTPVIGSSSGAIPEVIDDAGLIFLEEDPQDLYDKLSLLLKEPGLHLSLSMNGRARVLERYSHEAVGKRWYEIFASNLQESYLN